MSIPVQNPIAAYTGNGSATQFAYNWYLVYASDIAIQIEGVTVPSNQYTVTGIGNVTGGNVVFNTAPAAGVRILMQRDVPLERLTNYIDNGDLLAQTVNADFDRIWMALQDVNTASGYSVRVADQPLPVVPQNAVERVGKVLTFDNNGNPVASAPASGSAADVLAMLASDSVNDGDALIRVKQPYNGAVARTQHDKNSDKLSAQDFGAKGDGQTDDTAAFTALELAVSGQTIDLSGKTYLVSMAPSGNKYANGSFLVGAVAQPAPYNLLRMFGKVIASDNAVPLITPSVGSSQALIALGNDAGMSALTSQGGVVIGEGAHRYTQYLPYNTIAIGRYALARVQPADSSLGTTNGNRNIGIGAYAGLFTVSGYQNVFLGRNTGSGITTGYQNTLIGTGANSGEAPNGLSGEVVNIKDMTGFRCVAVGYNAGKVAFNATDSVFIGGRAGQSIKGGTLNTIVGAGAAINLGNDTAINGNLYKTVVTKSGTYSQSSNTITLSVVAHGAAIGDTTMCNFTSGDITTYTADTVYALVVSVPTADTLTISSPVALTTSGNVTLSAVIGQTPGTANGNNSIGGFAALASLVRGGGATAWGYRAAENLTDSTYGTFIGRYAGASILGGAANTSFGTNVTAIGNVAPLSDNNQVQLGNSDTTVMYYQMAQRSDIRDKADKRETILGLDFINRLQFVDYKWDMREDYNEIIEDPDGSVSYRSLKKDGSKKRVRWHSGVIAQEVGALLEELNIDSAIWQDHSKKGGADVQSIAYVELIAPLGKAIQELSDLVTDQGDRIEKLEARIKLLETQ